MISHGREGLALARTSWRAHPRVLGTALAAVLVVLIAVLGLSPTLPAYLYLGVVGVTLAAVDARTRRLPDALVLPSYPVVLVLLAAAAPFAGAWPLLRGVLGMVTLFVLYLVLALVNPAGLGFGDVKLAGLLGLALARLGLEVFVVGTVAGFVLVALTGLGLLVTGRATRTTAVPFGPFMLAGALLGIALGEPLVRASLSG